MGRPSRPRFGRRGHVNDGRSGGAGGVATTPIGATLWPGAVVVVGFVAPVGGAIEIKIRLANDLIFENKNR